MWPTFARDWALLHWLLSSEAALQRGRWLLQALWPVCLLLQQVPRKTDGRTLGESHTQVNQLDTMSRCLLDGLKRQPWPTPYATCGVRLSVTVCSATSQHASERAHDVLMFAGDGHSVSGARQREHSSARGSPLCQGRLELAKGARALRARYAARAARTARDKAQTCDKQVGTCLLAYLVVLQPRKCSSSAANAVRSECYQLSHSCRELRLGGAAVGLVGFTEQPRGGGRLVLRQRLGHGHVEALQGNACSSWQALRLQHASATLQ